MKALHIGSINSGCDGYDVYTLLSLEEKDYETVDPELTREDLAFSELEGMFYRESRGPGTKFCTSFKVVPMPHDGDTFIGIAQFRWDV